MNVLHQALQQASRLLIQPASTCRALLQQQARTGVVMRRMYPPRLWKEGQPRKLKKREYVYIMDDNTDLHPEPDLPVILTTDIEGFGRAGQVVTVARHIARNKLLPAGAAIYASPENRQKYEKQLDDESDKPRQTDSAIKTMRQLQGMTLRVPMNPANPWTLSATHVRVAFRKMGLEVPDHTITLPNDPISEPGETMLTVMVNRMDSVKVKAIVYHHDNKAQHPPQFPKVFQTTRKSLDDILSALNPSS